MKCLPNTVTKYAPTFTLLCSSWCNFFNFYGDATMVHHKTFWSNCKTIRKGRGHINVSHVFDGFSWCNRLILCKKFGFILYYIQFPFRLYLWVFTLGFITWLPELLEIYDDIWPNILLKVCFVGEFIRLYLTIRTQLKLRDLQLH